MRSSRIALGTMSFGEQRKWGCSPDEADTILHRFADAGGTTIDTAPNYADGRSEEIVGAFARFRRNELVLSTKYTASSSPHPLAGGNSRRSMVQSVEASLRRLQTDRIDLLWLHFWDFTTPLDEILRAADDLVSAGRILYFGLSDTPAWIAARAATLATERRLVPIVALQLEYNAAVRGVERDLLPMADALGLGTFCWGPLAAGVLAGGIDPKRVAPDRISPGLLALREGLAAIAERTGHPARRLALQWLLQIRPATIPIVGARTAEQLDQMLDDANTSVPGEILAEVTQLTQDEPLFPSAMIGSGYLRKFALGTPEAFTLPSRPRC